MADYDKGKNRHEAAAKRRMSGVAHTLYACMRLHGMHGIACCMHACMPYLSETRQLKITRRGTAHAAEYQRSAYALPKLRRCTLEHIERHSV